MGRRTNDRAERIYGRCSTEDNQDPKTGAEILAVVGTDEAMTANCPAPSRAGAARAGRALTRRRHAVRYEVVTAFMAEPVEDQGPDPRNHWGDALAL